MAISTNLPAVDVQAAFSQLSASSKDLNQASDELNSAIGEIEAALARLGAGVEAWHRFESTSDEQGEKWWQKHIGYVKSGGRWALAIRSSYGHAAFPDADRSDDWPFTEAPRKLRIQAVPHIAALLLALDREARKMKADTEMRTAEARSLASALKTALPPSVPRATVGLPPMPPPPPNLKGGK